MIKTTFQVFLILAVSVLVVSMFHNGDIQKEMKRIKIIHNSNIDKQLTYFLNTSL